MADDTSDGEADGHELVSSAVGDVGNVLLLDASSTDTGEAACFDLLTPISPDEENLLVISFTWSLDQWWEYWKHYAGEELPERRGFILVGAEQRSTGGEIRDAVSNTVIETVSNPRNLTEIGVKLTDFLSKWDDDKLSVVCFRALTPLLMHTDLQPTYRFLYTMTAEINAADAFAHYHLDSGTFDEQTVQTLMTLFDAVVEIGDDGTWKVRTR